MTGLCLLTVHSIETQADWAEYAEWYESEVEFMTGLVHPRTKRRNQRKLMCRCQCHIQSILKGKFWARSECLG